MRIKVVSDLHWEFHRDGGTSQLQDLTSSDPDVIVIAGDLTNSQGLISSYRKLSGLGIPIVGVLGNHEFYGSSPNGIIKIVGEINTFPNIHVLWRERIELNGVGFCGSTLWFQRSSNPNLESWMNDFKLIKEFSPWVYDEAQRDSSWFYNRIKPGDLVISHYLPSYKSVNARFIGNALNDFFVHDVEKIVYDSRAALWIHGHTHDSCDYRLNETRVIANPFGYVNYELNKGWNKDLVVEL